MTEDVVAVLGAGGTMGLRMARNLARAGIEVRAWNRSRERAKPLEHHGVAVCETPAEAADGADVLLTMLADAEAVVQVAGAALATLADSAIWLQMSTIGESATERCERIADERDIAFVDAPVLGTKQPAEEGKLVVLASGPEEVRSRIQPLFDAVGHRTIWVGGAGAGTRLKLAINSWVLAVVEAGAETIALAEGLGLDPALIFEALEGGALDLPYFRMKAKAISERDFEPSFRLALAAKDAALVEESARRRRLDLPVLFAIHERMARGAKQHGDKDMSATYLTSAPS
jgi:3-hydroxyisobutyrate dehydrogenase